MKKLLALILVPTMLSLAACGGAIHAPSVDAEMTAKPTNTPAAATATPVPTPDSEIVVREVEEAVDREIAAKTERILAYLESQGLQGMKMLKYSDAAGNKEWEELWIDAEQIEALLRLGPDIPTKSRIGVSKDEVDINLLINAIIWGDGANGFRGTKLNAFDQNHIPFLLREPLSAEFMTQNSKQEKITERILTLVPQAMGKGQEAETAAKEVYKILEMRFNRKGQAPLCGMDDFILYTAIDWAWDYVFDYYNYGDTDRERYRYDYVKDIRINCNGYELSILDAQSVRAHSRWLAGDAIAKAIEKSNEDYDRLYGAGAD